ncbi:MAG: porin family protein [Bacteroidales bacterium]|nr:porin family protein [Bacteroidales bacterium]
MKKTIISMLIALCAAATAFAQEGKMAVGAQLSYASCNENLGIGAKVQYYISDPVCLEASANYFFKNDCVSAWDINLNGHYLIRLGSAFHFYPLAGITFSRWNAEVDYAGPVWHTVKSSVNRFGINIGAGLEYEVAPCLIASLECKYQAIKDFDQAVISLGLAYKF